MVVCAKNEEKYIEKCLKCLKRQTLKPEIVVIDGRSKDKTVPIARRYADNVVVDNGKGISEARNLGWKVAKGDIVAYCDADCLPTEDWVEKISKLMDNNICIFGPIVPYEGRSQLKVALKIWGNLFMGASSFFKYPCICAANVAFKKMVFKKHRFRYDMLEDFDIGNRLRKIGRVRFFKELYMPISARRFTTGFHRIAFKFYLLNYFRLKLGKKMKSYL